MVNHGEKIKRQQYAIQILTCFLAPKELPASADIPGPSLEPQSLAAVANRIVATGLPKRY